MLGPVTSLRYYHGASTWATISAVGAAGSILGGLAASRLQPHHPMRWAIPAAACFALPPLALAAHLPTIPVAAMAAVGSTGLLIFSSLYQTTIQQALPEDVLSRVASYDWFGSLIAFPLGLAAAGPLVNTLGIRPTLTAIGLVAITSILGLLIVPSVRNLTASTGPEPAPAPTAPQAT